MRNRSIVITTALIIVLAAATALSAEPAYLGASELRALIAGKTIESQSPDGFTFRVYFDLNGQRLARQGDGEYALPWRIREDGTHCVTTGTGDDCARVARNDDGSYTRYRDGNAVIRWLQILPGKALDMPAGETAPAAPLVSVRQLGPESYEVKLSGPSIRTLQAAQTMAASVAGSICKARVPVQGTFRFESTEPLGNAAPASNSPRLELNQKFTCAARAQSTQAQVAATYSKEEKDQAAAKVLDETKRYFRLVGEGKVDEAFLELDPDSDIGNEASWKRTKRDFQTMAGALHRIEITKVTVYENPGSAAKPGLYLAADYRNIWLNVPLQCGYLVWLRTPGGEFKIIREETGHITAEQMQAMPPAQRQSVEQALHCR
ncbi:MAG: hypothetical protein ABI645_10600 [Pseudomonadota bacterium]